MSTGLSMASVNKIKELANQREYSLALEIVDSQDLSKSLNPQFLRLCGDIFSHAKRYKDARKVLVMAHRLAPESKRIIASMIDLYLKAGYKELAQKYYDIYMFDADENTIETKQVKYAYDNAYRKEPAWLLSYLEASFHHNMDYEWSYKTYLLLKAVNRNDDAKALSDIYIPTYKNTECSNVIEDIEKNGGSTEELIYVYAKQWIEDNSDDEQEIREEEEKLLDADELRIHPKEAEITIMFEEMGDGSEELSKRKLKKLMKEQEKQAREEEEKARQTEEDGEQKDEGSPVQETEKGLFKKLFKKNKKAEAEEVSEDEKSKAEAEPEETAEVEKTEAEPEVKTEPEETAEIEKAEAEPEKITEVEEDNNEESEKIVTEPNEIIGEEKEKAEADLEIKHESEEQTENVPSKNSFKFTVEDAELISDEDDVTEVKDETGEEQDATTKEMWGSNESEEEDTDMRELHLKGRESKGGLVVSVDDDSNDFTAESETIDDLSGDSDYSNPFESISAIKKEKEDSIFVPKRKVEFIFEDALLSDNDTDEDDVDEFVTEDIDDEFGYMEENEEETSLETEKANVVEATDFDAKVNADEYNFDFEKETAKEENEPEAESVLETGQVDDDFEFDFGIEPEKAEYSIEAEAEAEKAEYSIEAETEAEKTEYSIEAEAEAEAEEEYSIEAEAEKAEYSIEAEAEAEKAEYSIEAEAEAEKEEYSIEAEAEKAEYSIEAEAEPEIDVAEELVSEREAEEYSEANTDYFDAGPEKQEYNFEAQTKEEKEEYKFEAENETAGFKIKEEAELKNKYDYTFAGSDSKPKNKLDFPVFKSSLFPEHNKEIKDVENNFHELMEEAQDKMHENLLKEEQMQKEAEALLASLGIDLESINVNTNVNTNDRISSKEMKSDLKDDKASRDALKASLKIDSVKRDTLRKLKEYR